MLIWDNIWASISSSHLMFCQALSVQRGEAVKQVIIRVVITTMMIVMTTMMIVMTTMLMMIDKSSSK